MKTPKRSNRTRTFRRKPGFPTLGSMEINCALFFSSQKLITIIRKIHKSELN
ncbi:hypothetical protein glysoja_024420 [Glycine soja]|uniref:Uncharacterized protein n=1 Tax=Glycine soja TaxID=3848 RepID=A0A0B2SKL5_GLYSO|nr:hypothetical protein glysoja_024420 [Glycine soja]